MTLYPRLWKSHKPKPVDLVVCSEARGQHHWRRPKLPSFGSTTQLASPRLGRDSSAQGRGRGISEKQHDSMRYIPMVGVVVGRRILVWQYSGRWMSARSERCSCLAAPTAHERGVMQMLCSVPQATHGDGSTHHAMLRQDWHSRVHDAALRLCMRAVRAVRVQRNLLRVALPPLRHNPAWRRRSSC